MLGDSLKYMDELSALPIVPRLSFDFSQYSPEKGTCSVIFLAWAMREMTIRCLKKVLDLSDWDPQCREIVVVENFAPEYPGVSADILDVLAAFKENSKIAVRYVRNDPNLFWSGGINTGLCALREPVDFVALMNNDSEPKSPLWLDYFRHSFDSNPSALVSGLVDDGLNPQAILKRLPEELKADGYGGFLASVENGKRVQHWGVAVKMKAFIDYGLYLESGPFAHNWSDLEFCSRLQHKNKGRVFASMIPDIHHWHQMSLLFKECSENYYEIMKALDDPTMEREYWNYGRKLFPEETEK